METLGSHGQNGTGKETGIGMEWTIHPAAERPGRATVLAVVMLTASILAAQAAASPAFGLVALLFLAISLRAFFLPRRFALDATGACESGPLTARQRIAWSDVRTVRASRFGVHLSPRLNDSRLLPDRGLFLRTRTDGGQGDDPGRRVAVEAFVSAHTEATAGLHAPAEVNAS